MRIIVAPHEAGERLDAYLTQQDLRDESISRAQAQKMIKTGTATINGKTSKPGYVVRENDVIEIGTQEDADVSPAETTATVGGVKIVEETDDYLVIEKPPGLLVHPAPNQKSGTLIDFLLKHDPGIKGVGDAPERPGIVHRLDRDASGLMVVVKTPEAFAYFKKQFQDHLVTKEYLAIVHGKPSKDVGTITAPIGRKKGLARMSARAEPLEGDRDAVSHYEVLERFPHASLVKVRTETGRMHQVRVHMKSLGHPLVGDDLYAGAARGHTLKSPRLCLHAATLGFTDPSGEKKEYHSELPADLGELIETLRKRHAKK